MQTHKVFPWWIWPVYLLLFSFSIPWYLPAGIAMELVFGLPLWLVLSISAVVCMAGFTLWVIAKYWKEQGG